MKNCLDLKQMARLSKSFKIFLLTKAFIVYNKKIFESSSRVIRVSAAKGFTGNFG